MIFTWLQSPILAAQLTFLKEFGELYYLPELSWSEEKQFRTAEMPAQWVKRLDTLQQALENVHFTFPSTFEEASRAGRNSEAVQERIENEVQTFLKAFIDHVTPFARRWLTFPLVLYGLGDPVRDNVRKLALAVHRARRGESLETSQTLTKFLGDLRGVAHPFFDDRALAAALSQVLCRSLFCFQPSLYAEHVCCP